MECHETGANGMQDYDPDVEYQREHVDVVNHPPHYRGKFGMEAIDVIEAQFGCAGHLPQAMGYILWHQAKGTPVTDLAKAKWYVDRMHKADPLPAVMPRLPLDYQQRAADAFDLKGRARDALFHLIDAATFKHEADRRMFLRNCSGALEDAIKEAGK